MNDHALLVTEIARIVSDSETIPQVLDGVVRLVARHVWMEACTIWMLDVDPSRLVLVASEGLSPSAVGVAVLERGQGLTWQVLDTVAPVSVEDVRVDPRFHLVPEAGEEGFRSFLGVPLTVRRRPIGALVVQTRETHCFTPSEVGALSAMASQLAPVINEVRLLRQVETPAPPQEEAVPQRAPRTATGTGCASGVVVGPVALVETPRGEPRRAGTVEEELARLAGACDEARDELVALEGWLREQVADEAALIFVVQLMMLEDDHLTERMRTAVEGGADAVSAVEAAGAEVAASLSALDDPYFGERAEDVRDLTSRITRRLLAETVGGAGSVHGRVAVVSFLGPSMLVWLRAAGASAVLAPGGGATSHAALLARSLDLPLIVGLGDFIAGLREGQRVLLDASTGTVVANPPEELVQEALQVASSRRAEAQALAASPVPDDGPLRFEANVSLFRDAIRASEAGADGVGLYRTEFAFLMRPDLPDEAEQHLLYRRVVEQVSPKRVTFRVLDAGGDKIVPGLGLAAEPNPFLGYRSLRLLLDHPEVLVPQVRAICRASDGHHARMLLPMVTSVDEVRAVRELLAAEGGGDMPLGGMIEVPSALLQLSELADACDFLSVGTNDLGQHLLAVDRTNERVTRFLDPCHCAVVRAIARVAEAARAAGKPLSVCGEMASDPLFLPLWIALGLEGLSVHVDRIRILRVLAARTDAARCRDLLPELLELASAGDIRELLTSVAAPEALRFSAPPRQHAPPAEGRPGSRPGTR